MAALLILAAGRGSRYGAPKQLEPVGPGGGTILDYTIHDAVGAGFSRVVLVIRRELAPAFDETVGQRWRGHMTLSWVLQDEEPALAARARRSGRTKPWGTAHAVMAGAAALDTPFAVVNADDFYGRAALTAVGAWLRDVGTTLPLTYALATYPLTTTLADSGGVNRAVCDVSPDGWVRGIREVLGIERAGGSGRYRDGHGNWVPIAGETPVSMNLWGLTPAIVPQIDERFRVFLDQRGDDPGAELLLPNVIGDLIAGGAARVRAIPAGGGWQGLTHRSDLDAVRAHLARLRAAGEYPDVLASPSDNSR